MRDHDADRARQRHDHGADTGRSDRTIGEPILETHADVRTADANKHADRQFIAAGLVLLDPAAKERAQQVRIRAGDPLAQLLRQS